VPDKDHADAKTLVAIFKHLRQRQRRLTNYQCLGLHSNDGWKEFTVDIEHRARIKHLQLSLRSAQIYVCEQVVSIFGLMRNLTSLELQNNKPICDDTNVAILELLSRAFSVDRERPQLRTLRLKGVRLLHDDHILP